MIRHKSVLLNEAIEQLNLEQGDIVVDATLGGGGHSLAILEKIGEKGTLIALDMDEKAIEKFRAKIVGRKEKIYLVQDNFSNIDQVLSELKIEKVDAILADLGYSSDQLEDKEYGMSFLLDASLDMRLDRKNELTAQKIVNEYEEKELERIIKTYGEERFARRVAHFIVAKRKEKEIRTTRELADIIQQAIPEKYSHGKIHPATKTFQAIRIEVNQELKNLEIFVPKAIASLQNQGRLAIIAFHSLEDRIIKKIFRDNARGCICPKNFPVCICGQKAQINILTKKPIIPVASEIAENPRARSAKLRVCQKIPI